MGAMKDQYGPKEGEKVFYASKNRGTIKGVEEEIYMNWQDKVHNSLAEGKGGVKSLQRRLAAQTKAGDTAGAAATRTALQYRTGTRRDARLSVDSPKTKPAVTDAPDLPQKKPAFSEPRNPLRRHPTRGKEGTSKEVRRAVQRAAGGGDKLTGGEGQHHWMNPPEKRHRIKISQGEKQSAPGAEVTAGVAATERKDRAARRIMGNPDLRKRGSFKSFSQRQDSETQLDWKNKLYESLTESRARYGGMVGYSGGGGKNKPGVIMSIETDKDGNKFVVTKDKEGNVVSRKPAKPLPGQK